MGHVFELVRKVAAHKTTVLITGESGTGKELFAQAIHRNGNRSAVPLVAINCGSIPENLLESELFGYKKGAFVIYNSELFEATSVHSAGNGQPREVGNPAIVADGWKSHGLINNPALAENEELATLFSD